MGMKRSHYKDPYLRTNILGNESFFLAKSCEITRHDHHVVTLPLWWGWGRNKQPEILRYSPPARHECTRVFGDKLAREQDETSLNTCITSRWASTFLWENFIKFGVWICCSLCEIHVSSLNGIFKSWFDRTRILWRSWCMTLRLKTEFSNFQGKKVFGIWKDLQAEHFGEQLASYTAWQLRIEWFRFQIQHMF